MKSIIPFFLLSIFIYSCDGSKTTEIQYEDPKHEHSISFDTLKKEAIFNRSINWFRDNKFKFTQSAIDKQDSVSGAIVVKLVSQYNLPRPLYYIGYTLTAAIQDYTAKFTFSDLHYMDASYKKYTAASEVQSILGVDEKLFHKILEQITAYVKK